eukprot:GHRQ01001271.1.p1 GENE.GHRQ01001271.1~~GHRQ01001271.1.p1  ORF type:complete len:191 (+),score=69.53 GHRQ01001271.1:135-707(+)
MKHLIVPFVLACALASVQSRALQQAAAATTSVSDVLARTPSLSTFNKALKASGISIPANAAWTIFAPTNDAFADDDIREDTGLTAQQLLQPANRQALKQLLQYHIVPSGALRAAQLRKGQQLTTALAGAPPLKVEIDDGKVEIKASSGRRGDDGSDADVKQANIMAGNAIIHVVDEVLIPASLRPAVRSG